MAELTRAEVRLIPQWIGHGKLEVRLQGGRILLRAEHVERLAGIPAWSRGATLIDDEWTILDGTQYYPLQVALTRCESADTALAAEFLAWLEETLEVLLVDAVLDDAQQVPSFFGSYSVQQAARTLSADLGIRIAAPGVFAHMHWAGWTTRDGADWAATDQARRAGWLTLRHVTIPNPGPGKDWDRERPYPQLYITPAGLDELRDQLRPAPADTTPPPAPIPLFEEPR